MTPREAFAKVQELGSFDKRAEHLINIIDNTEKDLPTALVAIGLQVCYDIFDNKLEHKALKAVVLRNKNILVTDVSFAAGNEEAEFFAAVGNVGCAFVKQILG